MRVLVAPLDWGLGHATRCIPVIRELQLRGCEVLIAGSGDSLQLLCLEFPQLKYFSLPGYQPRYPTKGSMVWTMAFQLPGFMRVIASEHKAIEKILAGEHIDLIISDNRYGCWSGKIPSVFITHQSNILMPKRFGWLQDPVRRLSDRMINRFDHCWIPDLPGDDSLAGDLALFEKPDVKIKKQYIGWLSRFGPRNNINKKYDVVAIFSGPEPQRSLLENIVVPQLRSSALKYRVVRGLPGVNNENADDRIVNFLASDELQECIDAAHLVIARSGYSTIMDMHALGKKVVFVPTPGQTEQKYLSKRLKEKRIAFCMEQNEFNLQTALNESKKFSGFTGFRKDKLLKDAVDRILGDL